MAANVCVCAVVGFRSRHCPRGQTLNEDNTLNLHVTPPLRKHFLSLQSVKFDYKQKNKEGAKISKHLETSDFVNNDNPPSLLL